MRFTCAGCGRKIGASSSHYLVAPASADRVLCGSCIGSTRRFHAAMFPECDVDWHDLHDHRMMFATYAGARAVLRPSLPTDADRVRVSELIESRECSPMCLMGQEEGRCKCVCGGAWHGALMALDPFIERRDALGAETTSSDADRGAARVALPS